MVNACRDICSVCNVNIIDHQDCLTYQTEHPSHILATCTYSPIYIHVHSLQRLTLDLFMVPVQAPVISYDFVDGDSDPINEQGDWHGTRCAGIVSAAKDGRACGVGVAYNSMFGGMNSSLYLFYKKENRNI